MPVSTARLAVGFALLQSILQAQSPQNVLQRVYGAKAAADQPMLSEQAPGFSLQIAARELAVDPSGGTSVVRLTVPGIPLRFEMRYQRVAGIDLYRIRHAADSELRGDGISSHGCPRISFSEISKALDDLRARKHALPRRNLLTDSGFLKRCTP